MVFAGAAEGDWNRESTTAPGHLPAARSPIITRVNSAPPATQPHLAWKAPLASSALRDPHRSRLQELEALVADGRRISSEEALYLHDHADLLTLGRMADSVRSRLHPDPIVTYIVDRNINPTNVCITDCGFCAFYRSPSDPEAYVLSREEIFLKIEETVKLGGQQLLMQGGHHPFVLSDWWVELLQDIGKKFDINCHALSAPEIDHFAQVEKRPVEDVLADLIQAGLGSLPGAGAEILVERVRAIIAPKKTSTDRWLEIHRKAHEAGLRSSATMMFGNVETAAERVEHLSRLRDLQDETGGFTAFACWNTQPRGVPEEHKYPVATTPALYLRVQALARIFLDNIANLQTSYVTQGMRMAQVSLRYGANDFGGTMLEENVVSAAGCFNLTSIERIEHLIGSAGFQPRQRNSWYGIVDTRHGQPAWPANREQAATHSAAPPHRRESAPSLGLST